MVKVGKVVWYNVLTITFFDILKMVRKKIERDSTPRHHIICT